MTTVINIHEDSFMFMTGVMSCSWQCHVSLMHTPSNKVLPYFLVSAGLLWYCRIYLQAPKHCLKLLDSVLGAFITNSKALTHHYLLYSWVGWPVLSIYRLKHWYIFI